MVSLSFPPQTLPHDHMPHLATSKPHETIKPQITHLAAPLPPAQTSLDLPSINLNNISSILLPVINLFSGSVDKSSGPNASLPTSAAAMQQDLANNIAQMQALQRTWQSDPQAASHAACDMATVLRVISGLTSPTSTYSSLVSGRGSGVNGGNALAKIVASTNAGTTFSNGCSQLDQTIGKQTLSAAVKDLLGPQNSSSFAQGLLALTTFLDSTSNPTPTLSTTSSQIIPSYLEGTQLGNILSTIGSGFKSLNPLAKYNATQLLQQILSTYDSYLGGTAATTSLGSLGSGTLIKGIQGVFGNQNGLGSGGTLLADLQKLWGGTTSSTGGSIASTGLASAFTNGFASAFGKRRQMLNSHLAFF